ncbi:cobalamin B12-binding domain-containing protein [Desulfosporosinus shakirovi]|uniref:cobalamin B12-binding domain-containing protein n=1 Tax=Desulfosporosinus shakirovi TaxID=2885154 RepID=UPI001E3CD5C5|nr:cobalamin-dependent protein [Desulfosporosinus sp. SRJS8]MCB8814197.1 cobalamin-dependent protein [Desulfosporosinus sp. SRJS8]
MDEILVHAVEQLDEKTVKEIVIDRLQAGFGPFYIQEQVSLGMDKVGILYEQGEYFIADLIMAGVIFKDILELDEMKFGFTVPSEKIGTVIIGTAAGDLHDIGKNIFGSMLKSAGFNVVDLGVDVSPEDFCRAILGVKPDIVAISGVLTIALESINATIELLRQVGIRDNVKVILGGKCVSPIACNIIGVDAYTTDLPEGVKICLSWV